MGAFQSNVLLHIAQTEQARLQERRRARKAATRRVRNPDAAKNANRFDTHLSPVHRFNDGDLEPGTLVYNDFSKKFCVSPERFRVILEAARKDKVGPDEKAFQPGQGRKPHPLGLKVLAMLRYLAVGVCRPRCLRCACPPRTSESASSRLDTSVRATTTCVRVVRAVVRSFGADFPPCLHRRGWGHGPGSRHFGFKGLHLDQNE